MTGPRRALCSALLLAPLAAWSAGAGGQSGRPPFESRAADVFPFKVHERTLDNGFRMLAIPYDSPGIVSFYLIVRTGSRDEVEPGHSGFAHFFEHMMFRGTERYSPEEYNDVLKRMGADANASTWDDRTVYYMTGPASGFETMVEIEADRFKHLKYMEPAFRTEALAVLGEYNKSASNPFLALEEKLRALAFTHHTYRHTTLGFLEDIKAMPEYYAYSLGFFRRFYRPDNVMALIVGDVRPEPALATVTKHFSDWKPGYQAPVVAPEPPQTERRTAHIEWPNPTRPYLMLGYHAPAFSTATIDTAALDVIGELLFSQAAPLHQEVVVKQQWADFISGGAEDHRDPYLFTIAARAKSDEALAHVRQALDAHLDRLKREPVDPAMLARVVSHLRYSFAQALDTPDGVADRVSHYVGLTGRFESINELFRRYEQVTPDDVRGIARRTFEPRNSTVVTLAQRPQPSAAKR
ncbi:MAG: insulinase family protein [Acidobacteriota bacterium]|nr:insulinase family protein [Acidobacteriota bacterium]